MNRSKLTGSRLKQLNTLLKVAANKNGLPSEGYVVANSTGTLWLVNKLPSVIPLSDGRKTFLIKDGDTSIQRTRVVNERYDATWLTRHVIKSSLGTVRFQQDFTRVFIWFNIINGELSAYIVRLDEGEQLNEVVVTVDQEP